MQCNRCQGIMMQELFEDTKADTWITGFPGWRCPTCGNILDPIIVANRLTPLPAVISRVKKRHNAQAL